MTASAADSTPLPARHAPSGGIIAGSIALASAAAGLVTGFATALLSTLDVGGETWSLQGNGALVVPFVVAPAVLAGGWVALALWSVAGSRWRRAGLAAGALALVVALTTGFGPVVAVALTGGVGPNGQASDLVPLLAFAFPLLLSLAGGLTLATAYTRLSPAAAAAAVLVTAGTILAAVAFPGVIFLVGPLLALPAMVALPIAVATKGTLLGAARRRLSPTWYTTANLALPLGLALGLLVAGRVAW